MARTGPGPVLRIRVRRRYDEWSIEKQTRVEAMTLAPSRRLPATGGRALLGAWYELVDRSGDVLYRGVLPHPPDGGMEVLAEGGGLQKVDAGSTENVFDVLVPDHAEGHDVLLYVTDPRAFETAATVVRSRTPVARLALRGNEDRG
jgi:hypothetical protein